MSEFTPDIADQVLAACQAGAAEAGEALSRALDHKIELVPGDAGTFDAAAVPGELVGPGLIVVMKVQGAAALLAVPESSGILPSWYQEPDTTGTAKLTTLAQELGMLLLPEAFAAEDFLAGHAADLLAAVQRGELAANAGQVNVTLKSADNETTAWLVWPASAPDKVLEQSDADFSPGESAASVEVSAEDPAADSDPASAGQGGAAITQTAAASRGFPSYGRSLLKIEVPLVVTLASKKQSVASILKIGPGSIIQFEKSCDETLDLEIGDQHVARGEAVKVGDKFGLRITSIVMPQERFIAVRGRKNSQAG